MDAPAGMKRGTDSTACLASRRRLWLAALALAVVTFLLFSPLLKAHFVDYDDNVFVTQNARIQSGVTWEGVRYFCTHLAGGFYAPLTAFSHMLDCQLYGTWAGGHHLTNILLHLASTLLLLLFLVRVTEAPWRSLLAAALFAVHPLHVESVAWVAERKDVLSGLFFILTLLAYARYARRPSWKRYAWVVAAFLLGLLSKSMLVTLPFLLLLLDYWPLGRMTGPMAPRGEAWPPASGENPPRSWGMLVLEKVPMLALSLFFSWLTAQDQPIIDFGRMPLSARLMNAAIAYGRYTLLTFIPHDLAVFYPLDFKTITLGRALAWGLPVAAITAALAMLVRKKPYLIVGWLWFVGLLVPVIGLIQLGAQARADRYTYLPSIGLFVVVAWGLADLLPVRRPGRQALQAAVALWLAGLLAVAAFQVGTWHDTRTLFLRDYEVTHDNARAARFLGQGLVRDGKPREAIPYFQEALRIVPTLDVARLELARIYVSIGRLDEAAKLLLQGMTISPLDPDLESAFLQACGAIPDPSAREQLLARAALLHPLSYPVKLERGRALAAVGRPGKAVDLLREAVAMKPRDPVGRCYLAHALYQAGHERAAADTFRFALILDPRSPDALSGLAWVLLKSDERALKDPSAALHLAEAAVWYGGRQNPYFQQVLAEARAAQTGEVMGPEGARVRGGR